MSNYVVSARKYRPSTFDEVIGQKAIANTLENAIEKNQLPQALLFCGPRGVGKTTCARILAKRINEVHTGDVEADKDFSFNIFELDAASNNSVDDIRQLIDQVRFPPQVGKYKVYIIDEVHMLTSSAFNAFLKTLEEPPAHAIFILATTEKHKIIPTILSRCQIYDFKRISVHDTVEHLKEIANKEGVSYQDDALLMIAKKADGALRDALSIFDRLVNFSEGNLTVSNVADTLNVLDNEIYLTLTNYCLNGELNNVLLSFDDILKRGFDAQLFIGGFGNHLRNLLIAKMPDTTHILELSESSIQKFINQAKNCSTKFLLDGIKICNSADINYKTSKNQRLTVELALMQLCTLNIQENDSEKKNFEILSSSNFKNSESNQYNAAQIKNKTTKPLDEQSTEDIKDSTGIKVENPTIERVEPKATTQTIVKASEQQKSINKSQETLVADEQDINSSYQKVSKPSTIDKEESTTSINNTDFNLDKETILNHKVEKSAEPNVTDIPAVKQKRPKKKRFSITAELDKLNTVKEDVQTIETEKNLPEDSFDDEDLIAYWRKFQNDILKENPVIGHVLQIATPSVKENYLILEFSSKSSIEEFNTLKDRFLTNVRVHFNNYSIQTKCVETKSDVNYVLSSREKFQLLVDSNPIIDVLRKELDLDIDNPL